MKIEERPFINRYSELAHLKQQAEEIAQGGGEDLFLFSPWGRGKSALLKELKEILFWSQQGVIPVYFSFSRDYVDLLDFSEEYLVSVLSQVLLFGQKEGILARKQVPFSFPDLQSEAERQGEGIVEEVILSHKRAVKLKDDRKGLLNALTAPRRIAQAGNKPIWMMIDHVQAVETLTITGKGIAGLWREAIASSWAPHLFSGEPPAYLLKNLLPSLGPPNIPVMELGPFPVEAEEELTRLLEKIYKVKIARDLSKTWFLYLESNPGFLTSLLRDARLENSGLESHQRFVNLYLKSFWQGELGRLFEDRLYGFNKINLLNGRFLIKILNQLLKLEGPMLPSTDLQKTLNLPSGMVQPSIRLLERSGLVWERFGNIGLENNRVIRDWAEVLVHKYLYQENLDQIINLLGKRIEKTLSKFQEEESPSPADGNALHFNLILPINSGSELVAVRALEQIATYSDLDEASIEKVKMALIEACINAGEHSQSFEKKIRVYFTVRPETIEVVVEDRGQAFDPVEVQARLVREADPLSRKRGRGLALIKELMDEVRFEKADIGTRLYMVKKNPTRECEKR